MILDCPQCHARFGVPDAMIPPTGRVVRCSKCTHQWYVPHPDPVIAAAYEKLLAERMAGGTSPDEIKPLPKGSNVPALKKRKALSPRPFMIAVPLILVLWAALAFITYFPQWLESPMMASVYRTMGVETTDGLLFSDLTMERVQEGSKTKFILAGSIRNHAGSTRAVPTVRVVMKDKDGKKVWGREYPVNAALKPGEIYPFRITNVETSFASSVSSIVLDLGHPLELLMR